MSNGNNVRPVNDAGAIIGTSGTPSYTTTAPSTDIEGGGKSAISTTPVEITFTGTPKSIIITADYANSGLLYIGKSDVLSDGSNALTFLTASDSLTIQYEDGDNPLYIVASVAGQNFFKGAVL